MNSAPMTITATEYNEFCKLWNEGKFTNLSFGQSFLGHHLDKLGPITIWHQTLYKATPARAEAMILQTVDWNN